MQRSALLVVGFLISCKGDSEPAPPEYGTEDPDADWCWVPGIVVV